LSEGKERLASPTKQMKQILVAEPGQAINKKAFAIDIVVGNCSAANTLARTPTTAWTKPIRFLKPYRFGSLFHTVSSRKEGVRKTSNAVKKRGCFFKAASF